MVDDNMLTFGIRFTPKPGNRNSFRRFFEVEAHTANTALAKARTRLEAECNRDPELYDWKIESVHV